MGAKMTEREISEKRCLKCRELIVCGVDFYCLHCLNGPYCWSCLQVHHDHEKFEVAARAIYSGENDHLTVRQLREKLEKPK